jgi:thiol-disulfide isomerase/thioredoxin
MRTIQNLFVGIISFLLFSSFKSEDTYATIIVNVKNIKRVEIKLSINNLINSKPIYLINSNIINRKLLITKINVAKPTFAFFEINGESTPIIIYPNDSTIINYAKIENQFAFSFNGTNEKINNSLLLINKKLDKNYNNSKVIDYNQKADKYFRNLDSLKFELVKYVDTISNRFMLNTDQYDVILKKVTLRNEIAYKNYLLVNQSNDSLFETRNIDSIPKNLNYFSYKFPELFILLEWEFSYKYFKPLIKGLNLKATDSVISNLPKIIFEKINRDYTNPSQCEILHAKNINFFLNRYGYSSILDSLFKIFKTSYTNSVFISPLTEVFYQSKAFVQNMEFPNFFISSFDNKRFSISDFKGKIIYIDIWATWCAPCINQIPSLQVLQTKLFSRNIVFLNISIDDDISEWRKFIKKNKQFKGKHFIYLQDKYNKFLSLNTVLNFTGIPRYIIIDKTSKIHSMNALSPDSIKLFEELLALTD